MNPYDLTLIVLSQYLIQMYFLTMQLKSVCGWLNTNTRVDLESWK